MIFETGEFINHQGVEFEGDAAVLDKPLDVFSVDDVNIGFCPQSRFALRFRPDSHRELQVGEMLPFAKLIRPCVTGDAQGCNAKDFVNLKAVE